MSQKAIVLDGSGKLLTIRRTETAPTDPLCWDLPGGDLDFGEDPKASISREIKEETGLRITSLSIMDAISELFENDNEFWVSICYTARATGNKVKLSYEHNDFKWVTPDEFLKLKVSRKNKKFVEKFKLNYETL